MRDKKSWLLLLIIIIIVVITGFIFFRFQGEDVSTVTDTPTITESDDSASGYQAVFLDNSQVYFGKVRNENRQFVTLNEIFYLQVGQNIQPIDDNSPANPDINLVKLGGELHGPTDEMRINRDHIILIEDLRENSNLVSAIKGYLENN